MLMKTLALITLVLAFSIVAKAQVDDAIIKKFDEVEYYRDLKIRTVYNTNHGKKHGYSIEFDRRGFPSVIGKYKHGEPIGTWIYSNYTVITYKKKETITTHYDPPYCSIVVPPVGRKFYRLYNRLTR